MQIHTSTIMQFVLLTFSIHQLPPAHSKTFVVSKHAMLLISVPPMDPCALCCTLYFCHVLPSPLVVLSTSPLSLYPTQCPSASIQSFVNISPYPLVQYKRRRDTYNNYVVIYVLRPRPPSVLLNHPKTVIAPVLYQLSCPIYPRVRLSSEFPALTINCKYTRDALPPLLP